MSEYRIKTKVTVPDGLLGLFNTSKQFINIVEADSASEALEQFKDDAKRELGMDYERGMNMIEILDVEAV